MTILCSILLFIGSFSFCTANPTPYDANYDPATVLQEDMQKGVALSNSLLELSGSTTRFITDWSPGSSLPNKSDDLVTVYLVKSGARKAFVDQSLARTRKTAEKIKNNEFEIDTKYEDCDDDDDCVENLYGSAASEASDLAIQTLSGVFESEFARVGENCHCVVLLEEDLLRFKEMFTSSWDTFLLDLRYESDEELLAAFEADLIPHKLLDQSNDSLPLFVPLFLLHELGHLKHEFLPQNSEIFNDNIDQLLSEGLSEKKYEEIRADLFASDIYNRACFSGEVQEDVRNTCITSSSVSLMYYVWTLTGKSKKARCLRYFDNSSTHPNLHLRYLIKDLYFNDSEGAYNLLSDFLNTRKKIANKPWINENNTCQSMKNSTFSGNAVRYQF